jgi:hypothetical protein
MDAEDNPVTEASFAVEGGTIVPGADAPDDTDPLTTDGTEGKASFTLKHGQSVTIADIPIGNKVRVAETLDGENFGAAGYTASFKDFTDDEAAAIEEAGADTGLRILGDAPRTFAFTNERDEVTPIGVDTGDLGALLLLIAPACLALPAARTIRAVRRRRAEAR